VFEPNDFRLWKRVTRTIASFLTLVWRQGALMGETPEKAFFVKCDEETNPPEVIDVGQLIVEIGLAPVKPAEFVIFRIGQMPAGGGVRSSSVKGGRALARVSQGTLSSNGRSAMAITKNTRAYTAATTLSSIER
jgi:hypothetical protein